MPFNIAGLRDFQYLFRQRYACTFSQLTNWRKSVYIWLFQFVTDSYNGSQLKALDNDYPLFKTPLSSYIFSLNSRNCSKRIKHECKHAFNSRYLRFIEAQNGLLSAKLQTVLKQALTIRSSFLGNAWTENLQKNGARSGTIYTKIRK